MPSYNAAVKSFCAKNSYDCEKDNTLSSYVIDRFLKGFYGQAEKAFVTAGFELALFEYCIFNQPGCYIDIENTSYNGASRYFQKIKGGAFSITPIYPTRKSWWRASNGEKYQTSSRIYLYKKLKRSQLDDSCATKFKTGRKLPSKASRLLKKNPETSFKELLDNSKKGSEVVMRVTLPSLLSGAMIDFHGAKFDCILAENGDWSGLSSVFDSKIITLHEMGLQTQQ